MEENPAISVVIPVFNEQENVRLLYQKIREACKALRRSYEIVFVDDGSSDRTFDLLEEIHGHDGRVKAIRFRKNYGQTAAMAAGFEYARGEVIVSMDGDLQNDPADIPLLLEKMEEGYDIVCGWRKNRQDKLWSRRVPSVAANWLIGKVTGVRIRDNGCSLKAYRASVIKKVALYGEMHRFIPAMSTLAGARTAEIPVSHHPRRFGKSKYGIGRAWRVALDIVTVKTLTGFASRPGLWFGLFAFPVFVLGSLTIFAAVAALFTNPPVSWDVLFTVGLLWMFLGVNLLSIGLVAELGLKTGDYLPKKDVRPTVTTLGKSGNAN
ncbi:MAG: glycosyltransferase [Candidatus Poribacteria bacterium]|nr:glycosyltransferase [Candidatus Poribacteria bacterium]MDE0502695.1 glycosyltransferase [Candidatus Poribacteria bacterium]